MPETTEEVFSLRDAAVYLAIEESLLKNYLKHSKEINFFKRANRYYMNKNELDRWVNLKEERKITLTIEDYKKCLDFSFKIAYSGHTTSDFGTSRQRGTIQAILNWTQGTLAEIAFQKFLLEKFNITIELDFNVHGLVVGQDIISVQRNRVINPPRTRVSIKSGKINGCYLAVPQPEVELRERNSDFYIFVRIEFPEDHLIRVLKDHPIIRNIDVCIPDLGEMQAYICGYSRVNELDRAENGVLGFEFRGVRYVKNIGALHNSDEDFNSFVELL
jgi:hypothetical protein